MRWWNREGPWEFTRTLASDITVVANTSTYDLPYDILAIYDVRLASTSPGRLVPVGRRFWDTIAADQSSSSTPRAYDLFRQGTQGKIQLIPTPGVADTLSVKYYRRLTVPCSVDNQSATGSGASLTLTALSSVGATIGSPATGTNIPTDAVIAGIPSPTSVVLSTLPTGTVTAVTIGGTSQFLDIPDEYEDGIINKAIAIYLASREDRAERAATFNALAEEVLTRAKAVNFLNPDEEVVFLAPADVAASAYNPNSVIQSMQDYPY